MFLLNLEFKMMSKNGIVTTKLAREFMTMKKGDRIDTVSSYAKKFESARGTVQNGLKLLEEENCVKLLKRGHLGTFITYIDYEKLWKFTNWGALVGVSPLPYTRRHEGIATAIYYQMEERHIPFNFAYMQGAGNRIRGLLNQRYDFAILSKKSAMKYLKEYGNLKIAMEFKPYSYISGYVFLFSEAIYGEIVDGMKLGIDTNSPDHVELTEKIAEGKTVEYINVPYSRMIPSILEGLIDGAVYNKDTINKPEIRGAISYKEIDLKGHDAGEKTRAVILVNKEAFGVENLIKQLIDSDEVERIQEEVIYEKIIPTY
ncbi:Helix-turn-helix domain-containing protein [Sporanaerobacter acetigenes DSM 13106]|uniref:Helix-turn-helix domain-containing protein n=1 Tax=Sporanaerobacter acetigenes DSM 13106 TaxID=1123281 RepID=A0A1M5YC96_9FIRM|nr:Helix-turn-helix domain-containing protein [Sporanaerobacter acetigenes DSM 13106]